MNIVLLHESGESQREYDTNFIVIRYTDFKDLWNQVDNIACDGECSAIEAPKLASRLSSKDYAATLQMLCKKLKHGGQLGVSGMDLYTVSFQLLRNEIDVVQYNEIVFSTVNKGINTTVDTVGIMEEIGMKIQSKRIVDYHFSVIGKRP